MDWRSAPYVLLGDDIVIGDKTLAQEYMKILALIGVEVSRLKTHVSSDGMCEFAKR
jgi:hypothetical protein